MDYNNEEDYDAYLPQRSDAIYKEIESFEDYELTQCIVYEMAIRNSENQKKINIIQEYYYDNKERIFQMKRIRTIGAISTFSDEFEIIKDLIRDVDCLFYKFEDKRFKVYDILQAINQHKRKYSQEMDNIMEKLSKRTLRKGYIYENELIKVKNVDAGNLFHFGSINIIKNFQRPEIMMDSKVNLNALLNIDVSKPLDEIISYIKHIKKDLETNNILKAPIELLGEEELQQATSTKNYPKKPKAKKMADMFFIYDYVKARQNKIKELNTDEELRYKDELQRITDDKDLSTKEKKIQKATCKAEHIPSIIDTKVTDIFKEETLLNQLKMSSENISKMYYAIKPYIDDCKYKELITGVSTL
ncbi:MAG: hypothetical protein QM497_00330 [Sulfurimonas sp.]